MKTVKSKFFYEKAKELIPGGVNSPVRAFRAVGGDPLFIDRAEGSKVFDVDGNEYTDYVLSWGPMIAGHAHPAVVKAIVSAACRGTSYGAPTVPEIEIAELIIEAVPSIEKIRMVNSGTEATMSAIRVARGYTGRDRIIKFEGCYHGHADGLLVRAGSGAATFGIPDSPGVPGSYAENTLTLPFNGTAAFLECMEKYGGTIACVIVEPVAGNIGCVLPAPGFLETLREETRRHGSLLVFDEVMTGFRVAYGGAQALYGIKPDITCLGKIIGGGLPVGAYGGKREIMSCVSPEGPVYQAGTLSGNPLAMSAGIATLKILKEKDVYGKLETRMAELENGLRDAAREAGAAVRFYRVGSMFCTYFTETDVTDYTAAKTSDTEKFARFFRAMLAEGINLAPSQFEAGFLSIAHTEDDIGKTISAAKKAFAAAQ